MLLVRRLPIRHAERPFIRQSDDMLKQLYFGDDLLGVHCLNTDVWRFGVHGHHPMRLQYLLILNRAQSPTTPGRCIEAIKRRLRARQLG
jgi:hypothetical protein